MSADTSPAEFFTWRHHPFADTYQAAPFLSEDDQLLVKRATSLIANGKSLALAGASGTGKTTLLKHLLATLDPHYYRSVFIPYGGLKRSGILKALADSLGVDATGRAQPLIMRLQQHMLTLASEANPLYPVIAIDDAQLLERESILDLCALMAIPTQKTVAASLILCGDESLTKILALNLMTAIRTRLTAIFPFQPLDDNLTAAFIAHRLIQAKAPAHLFDKPAIELIAAHSRGNRRMIMNLGTLLIEEAFARNEKTISAQLFLSSDLVKISG